MKLGVLAALDQRIGLRYAMPPMTEMRSAATCGHHLGARRARRHPVLRRRRRVNPPDQPCYPRAVNNLALQALVAGFGADKAIVDESSTRTAIAEVAAD